MRWLLLLLLASTPAVAQAPAAADPSPFQLCEAGITAAGAERSVPETLMSSIARVESGRSDGHGRVRAWPWTTNINGVGAFYATKADAIAAVQANLAHGNRSIDVGCMQINLHYHPNAFASLEEAFDPVANAAYARKFLTALRAQFHTWPLATAAYHSQVQERGEDYSRKVFGLAPIDRGARTTTANAAAPAWPPPNAQFAAMPPPELMFGAFARTR